MIKILRSLALIASLVAAPSAFAIPFSVNISSDFFAGGEGTWSLSGPTSAAGSFDVNFLNPYTANRDISAGSYTWSIGGDGGGLGSVYWRIYLAGSQIYAGGDGGFLNFDIKDSTTFSVRPPVSQVPEPTTLTLLGMGVLALGVSLRRKTALR
jgi:hypothetical protein